MCGECVEDVGGLSAEGFVVNDVEVMSVGVEDGGVVFPELCTTGDGVIGVEGDVLEVGVEVVVEDARTRDARFEGARAAPRGDGVEGIANHGDDGVAQVDEVGEVVEVGEVAFGANNELVGAGDGDDVFLFFDAINEGVGG